MSSKRLSPLLSRKLRKFARLKRRLKETNWTARDRHTVSRYNRLIIKLRKLHKRIIELSASLRMGAAASALVFAAGTAEA